MRKLYVGFLSILIISIFDKTTVYALENNIAFQREKNKNENRITKDFQLPVEIIQKKISDYASTHSLYPFLSGEIEVTIDGYLAEKIEDNDILMRFIQISFQQKDKCIKAMFYILTNKASKDSVIDLCYLTNDQLITAQLFYDIMLSPALHVLYPNLFDQFKGECFVFIDFVNELKNGTQQKWIFFDSEKNFAVDVFLEDDGVGGIYFSLKKPKS